MAKYLIEQGVKFSTAVEKAVMEKDLELVKSMCQMNKSIAKNELLQNPEPLEAATKDYTFNDEITRYLIEQGANPNTLKNGCYLLHLQVARGNLKGARALIENGANINIVNQEEENYWMTGTDANAQKGQTALYFAIRAYKSNIVLNPEKVNEALEFISYLIEKKANSNIKDCNEKTPLDTAIFFDTP